MVTSLDVVLKPDQKAVVKYLLEAVATWSERENNVKALPEYLKSHLHDVNGACELITWIALQKTRSLRLASNLLFGNTIVWSYQVKKLCYDTSLAWSKIKQFKPLALVEEEEEEESLALVEEEERRKRTMEQMEIGLEDDDNTPKKKRKRNDDYILDAPKFTSRPQDITMPNDAAPWKNEHLIVEDLEDQDEEEYEQLFNMMEPINTTFVDRLAAAAPENVRNMTPDLELEIPPWRNNYQMAEDDEFFEPRHGEQRASMEREMDDARLRGHQGVLELDIFIPPPKTPRTRRKATATRFRDIGFDDENQRFRIPQIEVNEMMTDYSDLHYSGAVELRKKVLTMNLDELLSAVPYSMRKRSISKKSPQFYYGNPYKTGNEVLAAQFPTKWIKYDPNIVPNVEDDGEEEAEGEDVHHEEFHEEDFHQNVAHEIFDDHLPPIDLFDLEARDVESPVHSPPQSPEPVDYEDVVLEHEQGDDPARLHRKAQQSNEIRKNLLIECKAMSPLSYRLDSKMEVGKTTPREAADAFYAALVLIKNQAIKATQDSPFGPIDLTFVGNDMDDLDELANDVEAENGLDIAQEHAAVEVDNENI